MSGRNGLPRICMAMPCSRSAMPDLAGLDERTFAERLRKYGVSLFDEPPEDLEQDLKNA